MDRQGTLMSSLLHGGLAFLPEWWHPMGHIFAQGFLARLILYLSIYKDGFANNGLLTHEQPHQQ